MSSTETDYKDSVGNTALKVLYTPNSTNPTEVQYEFLDGTGASNYKTITLWFTNTNVKTNFGCSGVGEYTGTPNLPTELDIPTPSGATLKYLFAYEQTPNNSGYYTGRVAKVTLPTGGYYAYSYPGANDSINCADGTTTSMNQTVSDGTNSATWNFVRNVSNLTTTLTTPQLPDTPIANDTVFTFNSPGQETLRKIYANSPGTTLVRTIYTTWATNGTPASTGTILEDASTRSETDTTFDSNGLLDSMTEYDWGTGSKGSPLRTTTLTYVTSTNYTNLNIINLLTTKIVKDGSGTTQYRQDIVYDGVTLGNCPTGVPQHDDTSYPCTMNYRGNPTQVTTWLRPGTPSNGISKNFSYDVFGNLLTAQLNCCQSESWNYSSATQYSGPDSVTRGTSSPQLTTSYTYNSYTGLQLTATDPNSLVTNSSYDFLRRPTRIWQTNGSTTGESVSYSYDDTHFTTTTTSTIDSSKSVQLVAAVDGLGRTTKSTTEDVNNNVYSMASAQYDLLGRNFKASNPYTGSPSYWTTTQFDVLGRPISVTLPDNSATTYTYATNTATVTDPTGKKRESVTDGVGRLSTVFEPDPSNGNSLTLQTSNTYNVLDELTQVTQGSQTRSYIYDALGRLLSNTLPESGTTCFGSVSGTTCNTDGYDQWDNLQKRTDARGVLTSYTHDSLNRLIGIAYTIPNGSGVSAMPNVCDPLGGTNNSANVCFVYGTGASSYNNGVVTTMKDASGSESYTYNSLEQTTGLQKVINSTTYTVAYQYNVAGELIQATYPSGRIVQQSVDAIGRLCEIAPSTTGCGTAASPFATGYGYNTANQVTGLKYGNGIYGSLGFSVDRLQLNCLDYSTTNRNGSCAHDSTTKLGMNYSYGTSGSNDGLVSSITDSVDNGRTATYTYDALYRLATAGTVGSTAYPQWGLFWTYDRYGNRTAQTVTAGTGVPSNSVTVSTSTNRITTSGYQYDANGNMTNDGYNTLVYDGENRSTSASNGSSSATYTYDANRLRVQKAVQNGTTTVYIFSGGSVIAEYDNGAGVNSPTREYIYSGGQMLAKIDSAGTKYDLKDQLSTRVVTDSSGNVVEQHGHYPYGEIWYDGSDKWKFTTYERDSETGNDYAQARYYVNRLGRFNSTDLLSGSSDNPQSLNRYVYVRNNPVTATDPTGMDCDISGDCGWDYTMDGFDGGWGGFDGGGDLPLTSPNSDPSLVPLDSPQLQIDPVNTQITVTADPPDEFDLGQGGSPLGSGAPNVPNGPIGPNPFPSVMPPPKNPCDGVNPKAVNFVSANFQAAQIVAASTNTTAANILGLSGNESAWGGTSLAQTYNNYFGLTYPYPGNNGQYQSSNGYSYSTYPAPGFLNSAMGFARSRQGRRVGAIPAISPDVFAWALTTPPMAFNSESGTAGKYINAINTAQAAINCVFGKH